MTFDIQPYLDQRNLALWAEISNHFNVNFRYPAPEYGVFSRRNEATIHIPYGPSSKESLTHELLRLLLVFGNKAFISALQI